MSTSGPSRSDLAHRAIEALSARTCVVLLGLPGSGRRSLVARVRADLPDDEWRMLQLAGRGSRPLEALTLAGFLPGAPGRVSLVAAVDGLAEATGSGRALLVIYDADRLDDVSAAVVATVLDRTQLSVLAIAHPPFPGPAALDQLVARRDSTVLRLPPLAYDDMQRLLSDAVGGDLDADTAGRIYALSGGLPGIARAIALEARRAGVLTRSEAQWSAPHEVWTPALDAAIARLTHGLGSDERDALWRLAALGPADLTEAQRIVPSPVLAALEDRGLIRIIPADAPFLALFPPLLTEHFRHQGGGIRGRQAAQTVATALDADTRAWSPGAGRAGGDAGASGSTSAEGAAIIGRLMREQAANAVPVTLAQWRSAPSAATALAHVHALMNAGTAAGPIERVLADARKLPLHDAPVDLAQFRAWEASYRAFVRHDLAGALEVLDESAATLPESAAALRAVGAHLRLISGKRTSLPEMPQALEGDRAVGFVRQPAAEAVRMVRGEILLAGGRIDDAREEFARVSSVDPLHGDRDALVPLARLLAGDIDDAVDDAGRQLDTARGMLDRAKIEPYGHVVALGLYVRGRLGRLREHLTAMFAVNAAAPLHPASRAGLFTVGAEVALVEGNLSSARSLIGQVRTLALPGGPLPLTRIEPTAAALAVLQGAPAAVATEAAWQGIDELLSEGLVLAALMDGVRLVDLHVDEERTARLASLAHAAQGRMMSLLARYLDAALDRSPDGLLAAARALWDHDLRLHATRARVAAIRLLRTMGDVERATDESAQLRSLVRLAGDDLFRLVPSATAPTAELTGREREIAALVAGGMTNGSVAQRLQVSERTVDNHVYRIFRKLGIASRDELAALL